MSVIDDPQWQLRQLAEEYRRDRVAQDRKCPATGLARRCRYCLGSWSGPWQPRADRPTPEGHATCYVSRGFQEQIVAYFDEHRGASYAAVGAMLGVSAAVVRMWWQAVKGPN